MPTPCLCGQATSAPTCEVLAGPGIVVTPGNPTIVSATSGNAWTGFIPNKQNFTLGTGGVDASRFRRNGKTLDVLYMFRFGTGPTLGATEWEISLPFGDAAWFDPNGILSGHARSGQASFKDIAPTLLWWEAEPVLVNGGTYPVRVRVGDDAAGIPSTNMLKQGTPFTFATGDEIVISLFGIELV